jgi:hypothetical protein
MTRYIILLQAIKILIPTWNRVFFSIFLLLQSLCNAQTTSTGLQIGAGFRVTMESLYTKKSGFWLNWKIAASGSASYLIKTGGDNYYYPSLHTDLVLLQGGGSTADVDQVRIGLRKLFAGPRTNFLFIATLHPISYGWLNIEAGESNRFSFKNKPLYYFSDFTYPSLSNPFFTSFSIGTSFVYSARAKSWQRVGSIYGSYQNFQAIYVNDGPPFGKWKILGDGFDRGFTGDGMVSYYNDRWQINTLEATYHRYTGYKKDCYETSRDLMLTEVLYPDTDEEQYKYNTGSFYFRGFSTKNYSGFGLVFHDLYPNDIQHLIHYGRYFPYHLSPNPAKVGFAVYGMNKTSSRP